MAVKEYDTLMHYPSATGVHWGANIRRPRQELKLRMDFQRERQDADFFGNRLLGGWNYGGQSQAALQRRLDNVNRHFRRKAAAVFNDDDALTLLATLYESVVVETEDFDFCQQGRALAKLAAANFAEVGANGIFITESGQRFIDNINAQ